MLQELSSATLILLIVSTSHRKLPDKLRENSSKCLYRIELSAIEWIELTV